MATIPEIKKHLPGLYKILYDRACEVIDKEKDMYGFSLRSAKEFKHGLAYSLMNAFTWCTSPEKDENDFWNALYDMPIQKALKDERYFQYQTEIIIHDMWI
jgi:hypothetical protein